MLSIVDRYVARTFLSSFLVLMVIGLGLYVLFDVVANFDELTHDVGLSTGEVFGHIADFYLANLALYYSQICGPVMAAAAAFTLAAMARNNELTALLVAGMPLPRLILPIAVASLGLVALWAIDREIVIPSLATRIARTHDDIFVERTEGVPCARDENGAILTAARFTPHSARLERLYIIEPDAEGNPSGAIAADAAVYDAERGIWKLERGRRLTQSQSGAAPPLGTPVIDVSLGEYEFRLTPEDLALRRTAQWSELLSYRELNELLRSRGVVNRASLEMSRHVFITQPLIQWILMLLTLPFFLTRAPANVFVAGGWALLTAGAFYLFAFSAQSMVNSDEFAALLAWLPILVCGPIAAVRIASVKT